MSQIGDVIDVERLDEKARKELDPLIKLQLLMVEAKTRFGADPRDGNDRFAIVGRPRVLLQVMIDLKDRIRQVKLQRPAVFGLIGADTIGWWEKVEIIVRCCTIDDRLYCMPKDKIPQSSRNDRQRAGMIRMHAHEGSLERLREDEESVIKVVQRMPTIVTS